MTRFLFDTGVFVYAVGALHPYRDPCREVIRRARKGELRGEASADLLQELAHQRFRRTGDRDQAVETAKAVAALCRLHELRPRDAVRGLELYRSHERLGARDAVFAAVALGREIGAILSTDRAFDVVAGLERVDPADTRAVDALAS
ncbi:MAG: type II toxin-antitoxin system VapC family toxin [Thermoleophilaceae bacterium]